MVLCNVLEFEMNDFSSNFAINTILRYRDLLAKCDIIFQNLDTILYFLFLAKRLMFECSWKNVLNQKQLSKKYYKKYKNK